MTCTGAHKGGGAITSGLFVLGTRVNKNFLICCLCELTREERKALNDFFFSDRHLMSPQMDPFCTSEGCLSVWKTL